MVVTSLGSPCIVAPIRPPLHPDPDDNGRSEELAISWLRVGMFVARAGACAPVTERCLQRPGTSFASGTSEPTMSRISSGLTGILLADTAMLLRNRPLWV